MNEPITPEVLTKYWDEAGILMGTGVQYNTVYGTDNTYLLDVSAANPGRFIPVVILIGGRSGNAGQAPQDDEGETRSPACACSVCRSTASSNSSPRRRRPHGKRSTSSASWRC